jgi:hypothetical protein
MKQYKPMTRWQERRMINKALEDILPPDRTWQVALLAAALVFGFLVLFVRWWLCI